MYDFIDRPVTSLNHGARLLLGAMRHWVGAVQAGRCPCRALGPLFNRPEVSAAFPPLHAMMATLNRHAVEKMSFGRVDCARVSEHEALVIALVRAMANGGRHDERPPAHVAAAATRIVGARHSAQLLAPMALLAQALAEANRLPAGPIPDPDCTRFPR